MAGEGGAGPELPAAAFRPGDPVRVWSESAGALVLGRVVSPARPGLVTVEFKVNGSSEWHRKHVDPASKQLLPVVPDESSEDEEQEEHDSSDEDEVVGGICIGEPALHTCGGREPARHTCGSHNPVLHTGGGGGSRAGGLLEIDPGSCGGDRVGRREEAVVGGTTFAFTYIRELKRGCFGTVYLIENERSHTFCALKEVKLYPGVYGLADAETEVKLFAELNWISPYIVEQHLHWAANNCFYILMEYCDQDLADYLDKTIKNEENIPEARVVSWFVNLVLALIFLHENDYIHRDVKPENVMLYWPPGPNSWSVKLGDLGLCTKCTSEDNIMSWSGTLRYCSPEVLKQKPYSLPADIWSLGCTVYSMCELRPPFGGTRREDVLACISNKCDIKVDSEYSKDLRKHIIPWMLERKARNRPTALELLKQSPLREEALRQNK